MRGRVFRFGEAYFARNGMTALTRTPVLPEATSVGALSAHGLNRSRGRGGERAERARE